MIERLKRMKEAFTCQVESQLGCLDKVDAKELGEVVDMIKDLDEAIYYCTITKSMEEAEKQEKEGRKVEHHYYTPGYYRDIDRDRGLMYYPIKEEMMYYQGQPRDSYGRFTDTRYYNGNGGNNAGASNGNGMSNNGSRQFHESEFPMNLRDPREGRSPMSRKMYMESKEMHKDKATKMKELENYVKELGDDITEMIEDASPEEKQLLEKKISGLVTKIAALNNGVH